MTKNLFTSAMFAGLTAGVIAALLQFWLVIPLLLEGELYETGLRAHFAVGHETPVQSPSGPAGALTQDVSRHAMTLGFNVISFTAFALIMVAGMAFSERFGHTVTARSGAVWGVAGFIAMHLAPAIGLPPELPGTIAAEVELRQVWFLATVTATTLGLGLIAFGQNPVLIIIGMVALALPHIVGAPQLDTYFGIAPPELASLFVTRSLGVAAIGWVTMGSVTAYFWARHNTE